MDETMASIYEHLANIAFDNGQDELADELWNKHLDFLEKLGA